MQYSKFAVDKEPFCMWDWDLAGCNLAFINGIDAGYFRYIADHHVKLLDLDDCRQYAALALKTSYSHGVETLFSVLFAAIQAPDCVMGWLHNYKISDIRSLLLKIKNRQHILSKLEIKPITWETISAVTLAAFSLEDKEKEYRIKQHFAGAWRRFADDFLNDNSHNEYNSIKHGFRVRTGGFTFSIGPEDTPGVPAPSKRMTSFGGSDFGSSIFTFEKLANSKQHFRIKRHSRNWQPINFVYGLQLLSVLLENILSFLKVYNGVDPSAVQFSWPSDESLFQLPWTPQLGVTSMSFTSAITENDIELFSKDEILDIYQ